MKLDFDKLTPDNGAIRTVAEFILSEMLVAENYGGAIRFFPNQVNGKKVAVIGQFGLMGKAAQGCDPTYGDSTLPVDEQTWDINGWDIAEFICYEDLEGTLAELIREKTAQNRAAGLGDFDIADLTSSDYVTEILMPLLEVAVRKTVFRLSWFGDKDAKNGSGGVIKNAADVPYFTVTDGLWKRLFDIVIADAERRTVIAANNETTKAAQKTAIRAAGAATAVLDNLIEDAPLALRQAEGQAILISQALKDALDADIRNNNKGSELQWKSIFGGIQEAYYSGIRVIVLPMWDEIIKTYETNPENAGAWNKPYRAIYTTVGDRVGNLAVGTTSSHALAHLDVWFERKDQKNYILAKDALGTLVLQKDLVQVAF